jgi:hypothetical protein
MMNVYRRETGMAVFESIELPTVTNGGQKIQKAGRSCLCAF